MNKEPVYTIKCDYACIHCGTLAKFDQDPNWPHATTSCRRCGEDRWLKLATPVMAPPQDYSTPLKISYWSLRLPRGDGEAYQAPNGGHKPILNAALDVAVRNTGQVWPRRLGQLVKAEGRVVTTKDGSRYELGEVEREYLDTIADERAREQINGPDPIPGSAILT